MRTTPWRLVFMGTPDFARPSLEALIAAGHRPLAVVTQPDRPRGRGRAVTPAPVKAAALAHGLPVLQPQARGQADILDDLRQLQPELIIVVAFGQMLSQALLNLPDRGALNVHGSLLPRHRGAAPINWSIIEGDPLSGISLMWMVRQCDAGPVFLQEAVPIGAEDTAGSLGARLADVGAQLLLQALDLMSHGAVIRRPQPADGVTWAPLLTKAMGRLDFSLGAAELARRVRGLDPQPGAYTDYQGKSLKVFQPCVGEPREKLPPPGTVLQVSEAGMEVACGQGTLWLQEVQLAGGRRLTAGEFARGHALAGVRLG